jgi:hypothetical protein
MDACQTAGAASLKCRSLLHLNSFRFGPHPRCGSNFIGDFFRQTAGLMSGDSTRPLPVEQSFFQPAFSKPSSREACLYPSVFAAGKNGSLFRIESTSVFREFSRHSRPHRLKTRTSVETAELDLVILSQYCEFPHISKESQRLRIVYISESVSDI